MSNIEPTRVCFRSKRKHCNVKYNNCDGYNGMNIIAFAHAAYSMYYPHAGRTETRLFSPGRSLRARARKRNAHNAIHAARIVFKLKKKKNLTFPFGTRSCVYFPRSIFVFPVSETISPLKTRTVLWNEFHHYAEIINYSGVAPFMNPFRDEPKHFVRAYAALIISCFQCFVYITPDFL